MEKDIWYNLYVSFSQSYEKKQSTKINKNVTGILNWTKNKIFDNNKKLQNEGQVYGLTEIGNMLFKLRFSYKDIADTVLSLASQFSLTFKDARQVLKHNEDVMIQESGERLKSEKMKKERKSIKNAKILTEFQVFNKALGYLDNPKDYLEILCINKKFNSNFKKVLAKKVLILPNITDDNRRVIWPILI